jgi:hypothetical protein
MHCDHPHCPLPVPAFCGSTTPNATRSGTTKPLPGCLTRPVLTSLPTLYHVHTHLTSAHHRYAAQLFLDARVALVSDDPLRTAAGYATPLQSVGPAASIPHRIRCFPRHPSATTISGTALLSSSPTPGPLAQRLSRASCIPCARHYRPRRTHRCQPHHDRLQPDSALTSRRLRLRASPARCTRRPACPAPATTVPSRGRATRCLRARCDVFGAIPLQACIRHLAETRRVASAWSAASAAPVAYLLRRLLRLTPCCETTTTADTTDLRGGKASVDTWIVTPALPASACRAPPIQCASLAACAPHATIPPHSHAPRSVPPLVLRPFSPLQAPSIACAAPPICTPTAFSHHRRLSYPLRRDDPLLDPKLDTTHLRALRYYPHRRRLRSAQLRVPRKGSAAVFSARSSRTHSGKIPRSWRLQPLRARVRAEATLAML